MRRLSIGQDGGGSVLIERKSTITPIDGEIEMRIEKLALTNYRQFKEEQIWFDHVSGNDLHLVIGDNGTGKTNILNAINWCLYGDEPHLSKDSDQLPIVNLQTIEEAKAGDERKVVVEIWTKTDANRDIAFKREATYRVHDAAPPSRQRTDFEVLTTDDRGNSKILPEEQAQSYVARFVPEKIREFFFFDGERLEQYFRGDNVNIRREVFKISQLDLLESEVERKLGDVIGDLEEEAGKVNPEIENTRQELATKRANREEIRERIREAEKESLIAEEEIHDLGNKLAGVPDVEELEGERDRLKARRGEKEDLLKERLREKHLLLFERGTVGMLCPAIEQALGVIREKEESGEIPPTYDRRLLDRVLEERACCVCGQDLDDEASRHVEALLGQIGLSPEVSHRLAAMQAPLHHLAKEAKQLEEDARRVTKGIRALEQDIEDIEKELAGIERTVSGYDKDKEKIKQWYRRRTRFEEVRRQTDQRLGALRQREKELSEEVEKLVDQLDAELEKEERAQDIKKQRDFCTRALHTVQRAKREIMQETRKKVEERTQERFFDLIWKRETFEGVSIGSDYQISLMHSMGYPCLGSVSKGENELLALAFTLALHDCSGFNSPILIDTPVARITGEPRESFGEALAQLSESKQAILLFTPAEHSEEIAEVLDPTASTRFLINVSADEKVSILEKL